MMLVPWLFADRFRFVCIRGLWVQAMKAEGRGGGSFSSDSIIMSLPSTRWRAMAVVARLALFLVL
jgi:hypothetical protein